MRKIVIWSVLKGASATLGFMGAFGLLRASSESFNFYARIFEDYLNLALLLQLSC